MRHRGQRYTAALAALVLVLGFAAAAAAQKEEPRAPRKDMVLKGDATCTRCHDQDEEYPVLSIGKTRHGTVADARTPTCVSCHGESVTHYDKPAGVKERPKPGRVFGKNSATPIEARNQACLACHQGGKRIHWQGSTHASREVTCTSCHQVHVAHDKVRDKATQTETCFSCHKEQRAQSNRSSHHPIPEGKVVCSNCHNPHGSSGPKLLLGDTVNETCHTCHAEKRGPFLWEHAPVSDSCTNCHTPHGSNNASLLKNRAPYLCSSCHLAGHQSEGIRGNNLGIVPVTGKACVNCHGQIHGSNHPSGARFTR